MKSNKVKVAMTGVGSFSDVSSTPLSMIETGRIMVRALGESCAENDRLTIARSFGSRLVEAWWQQFVMQNGSTAALRPPLEVLELVDLPPAAEALANSIGKTAAELEAEVAAYHIGLIYTSMLPRPHRAALGIYYTPPALSDRLIEQASATGVDWTRCRVLDPACGGGAFLAPVARRITDALSGCTPRILVENIANRLRGYEIDAFAAWLSQVSLDAVMLPTTQEAGRELPVLVTVCDSLKKNPPRDRFDLVIGNPPYGRVRLDPDERARFKRSLFGHANLYGLFTDLALRHARTDGVIAYVTPTSFLAGEYFKNLRALLGRDARPVTLDFVSARRGVFDDVLQETLLATYKRGGKDPVTIYEITPLEGGESTLKMQAAVNCPPTHLNLGYCHVVRSKHRLSQISSASLID